VEPPAIDPFIEGKYKVNDRTCIRCYCCHEFCPVKAVYLERTRLDRMLSFRTLLDGASRLIARFTRR
jgi:Fe-S-cluster-containing hydrogenase component 2